MGLASNANLQTWPKGLPRQTRLQLHLHKPYAAQRLAIVNALNNTPYPDEQKAAERLASCCNTAFVDHDPVAGTVRPWMPRCQSRLCPFCGRGRTAKVAAKVLPLIEGIKLARHITLTYRARKQPLGTQLNELRAAFTKFRKDTVAAGFITGGIYSIEITRNPNTDLWHPHLHVLYDGKFFPQKLLCNIWKRFMKGGLITWISAVDDTNAAAWEISKYVNKPPPATGWPPAAIRAYASAVAGTRMLQTFGTLHNRKVDSAEEPPTPKPETKLVNIPRIIYLATQEVKVAQDLVTLLWCRWPMLRSYLFDADPCDCQQEQLLENPQLELPRPARGPPGKPLPPLPPEARTKLDVALDMTLLLWEGSDKAGLLEFEPVDLERQSS